VVGARPEADAAAGREAARPPGALVGGGAADRLHAEHVDPVARVEPRDAREARVDHGGDALDRERGLGDVGREHDATARPGPERPLLCLERLVAVQRDDVERPRRGDRRERLGGAAHLGRARQEDEDVPGIVEDPPERPGDTGGEVRAGGVLVVFDRHRKGPALGGQDGGVAERTCERVGL